MAVIRAADARQGALRTTPLHLGDLEREGQRLTDRTRAEVEAMLAEAERRRDSLLEGASERGFEEGREAGRAAGLEEGRAEGRAEALASIAAEAAGLERAWRQALDDIERERSEMLMATRDDLIRLAALVAERVTRRMVALDPSVVADQAEALLAMVARPTRLLIAVHPDDEPMLRELLPGLVERFAAVEHAELTLDDTLTRGSCVARTGEGGVLDASVDGQIERLVRTLAPDPSEPAS